jgi:SMC interacting uncharacterized protein involved in chromosome segregation
MRNKNISIFLNQNISNKDSIKIFKILFNLIDINFTFYELKKYLKKRLLKIAIILIKTFNKKIP